MRRWAELAAERSERSRAARAAVQRWRGSLLVLGMERWRALAARKRQNLMEVGRAFHRKTCRGPLFGRWHRAAARKRSMHKAVGHWRGRAQLGCWRQWTAPLGAMRLAKERLSRAARHLIHRRTAMVTRCSLQS